VLAAAGRVAARVELAVWLAAVDPHLHKFPGKRAVGSQVAGKLHRVYLPAPVRIVGVVESAACAAVNVLVIEEDHNPVRQHVLLGRAGKK
jgi:hypothetical protein